MIEGSYTALQEPDADALIRGHLRVVRQAVREAVPASVYAGTVLFGGYGRGEGGVLSTTEGVVPHNNYDLMVLTKGGNRLTRHWLSRHLRHVGQGLGKRLGVGVDISTLPVQALRSAPAQIFWYDVRRMHRIVDGPTDLMSMIPAYRQADISAEEQARLLLNRSTLLAINRWILSAHGDRATSLHLRTMRKHTVKAILGYGDAVLLALGRYVVSYQAKVDALDQVEAPCVSGEFRAMHRWATEFRFQPSYGGLSIEAEANRLDETLQMGERIAHWFESQRLGVLRDDWSDYLERFVAAPVIAPASGIGLLTLARAVARNIAAYGPPPYREVPGLYWWRCPPFFRVLAAAPAAMYSTCSDVYKTAASNLIGANPRDLVPTYVRTWARVLDPGAASVLRELGLVEVI